jgi:hypothetical protein
MGKYRKKPVVIEAMQLCWENWDEICIFVGVGLVAEGKPHGIMGKDNSCMLGIPTLEGLMTADEYDWIIKGIKGEFYPCKPDIFEATYEAVRE